MAHENFKTSIVSQRVITLDRPGIEKTLVAYFEQYYPGEGPFTIDLDVWDGAMVNCVIRGPKVESEE